MLSALVCVFGRKVLIMKKFLLFAAVIISAALFLNGCSKQVKSDPKNPVTITVWHYYNGALMNAFESLIKNFNETVGVKEGIIVEAYGMGNLSELEKAVIASANKEVGSQPMPNIFASYADTAYEAEKRNLLANLDDYFTTAEKELYIDSFIEEGRIGANGELMIFPIAKSTEILLLNETDWIPFANAFSLSYDDLATLEDITRVSEMYYEWSGGKAFFGRDSMANLFIISSRQFDIEIFGAKGEVVNIDRSVMRKIWDNYYVPYISGYFYSYGKFRSDDTKVGDILAYIGATSSAAYFPSEVTLDGNVYPINAKVLPVPGFKDAKKVMVQQGAGMAVTKSSQQMEYASAVFLKWFTDAQNNIEFSALSGYMPVKKLSADYTTLSTQLEKNSVSISPITNETLRISLDAIKVSELYTNKAFTGGVAARSVLEDNLQSKALADRESVLALIETGVSHAEAVAQFNTDDNFEKWLVDLTQKLNEAISAVSH